MDPIITERYNVRLRQAYVSDEGTRGLNAHIENDAPCFSDSTC